MTFSIASSVIDHDIFQCNNCNNCRHPWKSQEGTVKKIPRVTILERSTMSVQRWAFIKYIFLFSHFTFAPINGYTSQHKELLPELMHWSINLITNRLALVRGMRRNARKWRAVTRNPVVPGERFTPIRDGKTCRCCRQVCAILFLGCSNFLAVYAQTS